MPETNPTELQTLIITAASATAVWSEAQAEYVVAFGDITGPRERHDAAKRATLAAGAALAKALRGLE